MGKLTDLGLRTGSLKGISYDGSMLMINLTAFQMSIEEKYYEIVNSMLDKWSESIKKIEEQARSERESPGYLNWLNNQRFDMFEEQLASRDATWDLRTIATSTESYKEWIKTLPPLERTQELNAENRYRILMGMDKAVGDYQLAVQDNSAQVIPFVMASFAIGMTFMNEFVGLLSGAIHASLQTGVNVILQAVKEMAAPLLELNLAALGYFGALFAVGLLYQTSDQIALNVGGKSSKEVTVKFAKEYAKNMIQLMKTPDFNLFLNAALVIHIKDGKSLTDPEKKQLSSAMKLVLLSVALAVIYKSETGKITAEEFGAMLSNKIPVEEDPIKAQLKAMILESVQDLGSLKQPMLDAVISYLNTDPDFDEMFDVYRVFEGIRQTDVFSDEVHISQRG